jgi:hypothetical protein
MNLRYFDIHFRAYLSWSIPIMPCNLLLHQGFEVQLTDFDHLTLTGDRPGCRHKPRTEKHNYAINSKKFD